MTIDEAIEILADVHDYDPCCLSLDEACEMAIFALHEYKQKAEGKQHIMPCDVCEYGPPSSLDGKPCTMCPATSR